jgi:S-DNA-T family DNA segregation ATPase FtsK/SpoIIIE
MAKKSTETARGKTLKGNKNGLVRFLKDDRTRVLTGLFLAVLALLLSVAFVSFLFTWKADQSFQWSTVLSDASVVVENKAGKIGARLGNLLISSGFGVGAFFIPFILSILGLRLLKVRIMKTGRALRLGLTAMILTSLLLSYLTGDTNGYLGSGLGGAHGLYICQWLTALMGTTGTGLLLFLVSFGFLTLTFAGFLSWISRKSAALPAAIASRARGSDTDPAFGDLASDGLNQDELPWVDADTPVGSEYAEMLPQDSDLNGNDSPDEDSTSFLQEPDRDVELTVESAVEDNTVVSGTRSVTASGPYDPTLDLSSYQLPTPDLLEDHRAENSTVTNEELISNKNKIVETLANYKIQIDRIKATIGPTVTLYEIVPAPGVRISRIKNLEDDIALSLSALGIRIIAPMPGKGTIGIEVPNMNPEIVSMKSLITSRKFQESTGEIPIALGKTISNETFVFDLARMPHLLIAGATGQGKSVGLNAIITSILYKKHPAQIKFVLVDPKKVELTLYSKIERHFLAKLPDAEEAIITDTQRVINTIKSLCQEMDSRYELLKHAEVRNIKEYNGKFIERKLNPLEGHRYLPHIVVIIDEFADMIMTAGREIETPIARLAQLARAIGIHLVIATQRPTTNIITGTIKANFPARIAFRVTSAIDSRTILDTTGANQLIGRGDMLFSGGSDMIRIQCAFIDIPELERITDYIGSQQGYPTAMLLPEYVGEESVEARDVDLGKKDELFEEAARVLVQHQQGSTSLIQRKFSIGYNRAGRIMDQLEAAGIVGPFEGSKARQVLFVDLLSLENYLNTLNERE